MSTSCGGLLHDRKPDGNALLFSSVHVAGAPRNRAWRVAADEPADLSAAIEAVVAHFAGTLRRIAARFHLSDFERDELIQDVRLRLWRAATSDSRLSRLTTSYIRQAATYAVLDLVRHRRDTASLVSLDECEGDGAPRARAPDEEMERREIGWLVQRAIMNVRASRRRVVELFLAGYSSMDIAAMLCWSEPKARNRVYRGLAELRGELSRRGVDTDR